MKILLAGKNNLLESVLLSLVKLFKNIEIAIISSPIKSKIIKKILKKNNIRKFSNKEKSSLEKIVESFKPEIFISCGYDKILKKDTIKKIKYPLNIHFADLPKYKGFFCIPHAIRNEENKIGITIHFINESIDSGKIISKKFIKNSLKFSAKDLHLRAVNIASQEVVKIIKLIKENVRIKSKKQKGHASFFKKDSLYDYDLTFEDNYMKIVNYIRSFHFPPFRGLKFNCKNLNFYFIYPLEFKKAKVRNFGMLTKIKNKFYIQCKDGILFPKYVYFNNKKTSFNKLVNKHKLLESRFYFEK